MFSISKSFSFCYGHRLLGDKGKCKNLHGHTAKIVVHLESKNLDDKGMVCHFDNLKETIGKWIEENLDHAMLLSKEDPTAKVLKEMGERIFMMDGNPTAENIAKLVHDQARSKKLPVARVEIWESETAKAVFGE